MFHAQPFSYFGKARILNIEEEPKEEEPEPEEKYNARPVIKQAKKSKYLPGERLLKKLNKDRKPKRKTANLDQSIESVLKALHI
jgi:hypothetical protein